MDSTNNNIYDDILTGEVIGQDRVIKKKSKSIKSQPKSNGNQDKTPITKNPNTNNPTRNNHLDNTLENFEEKEYGNDRIPKTEQDDGTDNTSVIREICAENVDPIDYILNIIAKEVKDDDKLTRQILYSMLSSASKNPINLAINAPTGEGKSYALHKVGSLFSDDNVIFLSGMSDKALFHKKGKVVIKNEDGEYADLRLILSLIDRRLEKIKYEKEEMKTNKNSDILDNLNAEVSELEYKKDDLKSKAVKLIDLAGKVLIFMDTPRQELFSALMPLLSHDKYETTYEFVDKTEGITTNTNILRGFPSFIFSQAIDFSGYERAEHYL